MGPEVTAEPSDQPAQGEHLTAKRERFWDLKASHWVEVVLTAVLIVVGFLQFKVYSQQAGIMQQQTDISVAQFNLSVSLERPWISLQGVQPIGPLLYDDEGAHIALSYQLSNVGHTPAFDVRFIASATPIFSPLAPGASIVLTESTTEARKREAPLIQPANAKDMPVIDAQSRLLTACTQAFAKIDESEKQHSATRHEHGEATASATGDVVFPGDHSITKEFKLLGSETSWAITKPPEAAHSYFILLAACVRYRDSLAGEIRYTYSGYTLSKRDPLNDHVNLSLQITSAESDVRARLLNQYAQ